MNKYLEKISSALAANKTLIHLSFDGSKEGRWFPRLPDGMQLEEYLESEYPEPEIPRISLSTSPEKSFMSVYPNISQFFEKHEFPHIDMYSYRPKLKGSEKIVTPQELTEERKVWDAHETDEHWILDPVVMVRDKKYRFYNPGNESPTRYTYPFGENTKGALTKSIGPKQIRYAEINPSN